MQVRKVQTQNLSLYILSSSALLVPIHAELNNP